MTDQRSSVPSLDQLSGSDRSLLAGFAQRHLADLDAALGSLRAQLEMLEQWSAHLVDVLPKGGRLLVAGNGGSAAQAQHLVAELVGRYCSDRPAFSAIALCADAAVTTALANDYGTAELFARQVTAHGRSGDILLALSTSGHSPNVIRAAEAATAQGLTTWALTGPGPNALTEASAQSVSIAAPGTPSVQEAHQVAVHLICEGFDALVVPPT